LDGLAPNNSREDGTEGDLNTKTETCDTVINVTILPVIDGIGFENGQSIVQENLNSSEFDLPLEIPLGMNLMIDGLDRDGSEVTSIELSGFPPDAVVRFVSDDSGQVMDNMDGKTFASLMSFFVI